MQVIASIYILLHYWIINGHTFTLTLRGGTKNLRDAKNNNSIKLSHVTR